MIFFTLLFMKTIFQDVLQCYVCEKDTSGAHMCIKCDKHIHVICGTTVSEEGYGSKVVCPNCKIDTNRVRHRSGAMDSQLKQANTMIARSKKELGTAEVGQTVAVPIPMFDRGKGDSRNLLGRVIEVRYLIKSLTVSFNMSCLLNTKQKGNQ